MGIGPNRWSLPHQTPGYPTKQETEIDRKNRDAEFLSSLQCKNAPFTLTSHLLRAKQQPDCHVDLINSVTYPVVTTHGVETICSADEHKIIISRNQDFNEIMALVLRGRQDSEFYGYLSAVNTTRPMTADLCWRGGGLTLCFPFMAHVSRSACPDRHVSFCDITHHYH